MLEHIDVECLVCRLNIQFAHHLVGNIHQLPYVASSIHIHHGIPYAYVKTDVGKGVLEVNTQGVERAEIRHIEVDDTMHLEGILYLVCLKGQRTERHLQLRRIGRLDEVQGIHSQVRLKKGRWMSKIEVSPLSIQLQVDVIQQQVGHIISHAEVGQCQCGSILLRCEVVGSRSGQSLQRILLEGQECIEAIALLGSRDGEVQTIGHLIATLSNRAQELGQQGVQSNQSRLHL